MFGMLFSNIGGEMSSQYAATFVVCFTEIHKTGCGGSHTKGLCKICAIFENSQENLAVRMVLKGFFMVNVLTLKDTYREKAP